MNNIPFGTTHYSLFHGDIDYFKRDLSRGGAWFIYSDNDWCMIDIDSYKRYQTIVEIY